MPVNRWAMAAALDARLPQLRGRDRLLNVVRGRGVPKSLKSEVSIGWGPGLSATINPSMDGSLRELYYAQWVQPTLIPVLEACLRPGDLFVDVGANVGLYSSWSAKIVGQGGHVVAIEPVPTTRALLERICLENRLSNVTVVPAAVGPEEGTAWMEITPGASGISRVVAEPVSTAIEVPVTTLDSVLGSSRPALIKIDVEGGELGVFKSAIATLKRGHPPIAFEAPEYGGGTGTRDCVSLLSSEGYDVLSLTTRGIRAFDPAAYSHNLLAIGRNDECIRRRLRSARFPRSQNI